MTSGQVFEKRRKLAQAGTVAEIGWARGQGRWVVLDKTGRYSTTGLRIRWPRLKFVCRRPYAIFNARVIRLPVATLLVEVVTKKKPLILFALSSASKVPRVLGCQGGALFIHVCIESSGALLPLVLYLPLVQKVLQVVNVERPHIVIKRARMLERVHWCRVSKQA